MTIIIIIMIIIIMITIIIIIIIIQIIIVMTIIIIIDMQWQQASLPIKAGGLGIKNVKSIASPVFFASVPETKTALNFFAVSMFKRFS